MVARIVGWFVVAVIVIIIIGNPVGAGHFVHQLITGIFGFAHGVSGG